MPHVATSDGHRVHYDVTGAAGAPTVVLIQGLAVDKHGWDLQRLALTRRFRVVALDNRGTGRSDSPTGPYRLEQMADDVVTVLDHAGVDAAHVVGTSMGGAIAQIVAVTHPHRVRSLTLASTACQNPPWRRDLLTEWATLATDAGMAAMAREAARWIIGPRSFRRFVPAFGWMGPLALRRPVHAFVAQVQAILGADEALADRLGEVRVPTLVTVGNQDILTPRADSEELHERIGTAELVVVSGAAHGMMIEHATTFNRVLLDFLHRVRDAEAPRPQRPTDRRPTGIRPDSSAR